MTTLQQFYDRLAAHDWTYAMSDDSRLYRDGFNEQCYLKFLATESPEHQALYDAYHKYIWHNGPMPERPN